MDTVLAGLFQHNMENTVHFGSDVWWLLTSPATVAHLPLRHVQVSRGMRSEQPCPSLRQDDLQTPHVID